MEYIYKHILNDLSKYQKDYLLYGKTKEDKEYKIEQNIIYKLIIMNYDNYTIKEFFKKYTCNKTYFKKSKNKIKYLINSIDKARVHYNNYKSEFDKKCDLILQYVEEFTSLSISERIIFKTILRISKKCKKYNDLNISGTELQKITSYSLPTIYNTLKNLTEKKLLIKTISKFYRPSIYSINYKDILKNIYDKSNISQKEYNNVIQSNKNSLGNKKLGKSGYLILNIFLNNPDKEWSTYDLCKRLNLCFNTVRRKLEFLEKEKIIYRKQIKTEKRSKSIYKIVKN